MKVILPKEYLSDESIDAPLFFLAGPVLGGGDWQAFAVELLYTLIDDFYVVIPCRYRDDHDLKKIAVTGTESHFPRQTNWERYYLEIASRRKRGCIIFWLPCESKINPRNDGSPYARDTYGELGEWRGRLMHDKLLNVVIGAEADFPGLSVISANQTEALSRSFEIYSSLEETLQMAVRKSKA